VVLGPHPGVVHPFIVQLYTVCGKRCFISYSNNWTLSLYGETWYNWCRVPFASIPSHHRVNVLIIPWSERYGISFHVRSCEFCDIVVTVKFCGGNEGSVNQKCRENEEYLTVERSTSC